MKNNVKNIISIALLLVGLSATAQVAKPVNNTKKCYLLQFTETNNLKERVKKVAEKILPDVQVENADVETVIKFYTAADISEVRKFLAQLIAQKMPVGQRILEDCEGEELEEF